MSEAYTGRTVPVVGLTQQQLIKWIGLSKSAVANYMESIWDHRIDATDKVGLGLFKRLNQAGFTQSERAPLTRAMAEVDSDGRLGFGYGVDVSFSTEHRTDRHVAEVDIYEE